MARDLLLGKTRRNWARGHLPRALVVVQVTVASDEVDFRLTPAEMDRLAELSAVKLRADAGDHSARKQLAKARQKLTDLRTKARKGDSEAARALKVVEESGVFRGTQSFSLGADSAISNLQYRATVLKQARKSAKVGGRQAPTTRDFFAAKKAVDKTMSDSGISLYLPGSRPGRVTY